MEQIKNQNQHSIKFWKVFPKNKVLLFFVKVFQYEDFFANVMLIGRMVTRPFENMRKEKSKKGGSEGKMLDEIY